MAKEESYQIRHVNSAVEAIEWADAHASDGETLLLVEVTVARDEEDAAEHRSRIWHRMPATAWAADVGDGYTY
jgi:hypothetical protein